MRGPEVAFNTTRGRVLAERTLRTTTALERLKGLLGREALPRGEGLLIAPCDSIHTFFMRFPIDVLFLDGGGKVVRAVPNLVPWRATRLYLGARSVLELWAGALAETGTSDGDIVEVAPPR